jgi:hypothetical protein
MVHEREELRLKMVAFEKSASDKSRLYARGTKLLEEEKCVRCRAPIMFTGAGRSQTGERTTKDSAGEWERTRLPIRDS